MKKKLLLLGASLLTFGLIGGTLAAWAVTDKADPLNIGISPGTVSTDTTTNYVTLEWGSQKSLSNVSNLKRNEIRKAGVLDLKAVTDAQEKYAGILEQTLTSGNASGASLISTYLEVKVYPGDLNATDGVIAPETVSALTPLTFAANKTKVTVNNTTTKGSEVHNLYTVAVSLKSDMTLAQYDALADAQVTLTYDWNKDPATEITSYTLYATGFTGDVYVYAFGSNDNQNAPWPGVKMEETNFDGIYQANVSTDFTTVVFNNNNGQQSGDLPIQSKFVTPDKNRYTYVADSVTEDHGTFDKFDAQQEKVYYVVGNGLSVGGVALSWPTTELKEAGRMTIINDGAKAQLTGVTTTLNGEFKIYEKVTGQYYPTGDNWLIQAGSVGSNVTITYTIGGTTGDSVVVVVNP